jgi:hypothetical protein
MENRINRRIGKGVGYYLLHTKDAKLCIEEIEVSTTQAELALERTGEPVYVKEEAFIAEDAVRVI